MSDDGTRFRKIINEGQNSTVCTDCGANLEEVEFPALGIGDYSRLPMMYCPNCQTCYIHWEDDNGNK